jgi:ribosomal protein S18 acetylase RimI-like enzyme
VEDPRHVGQRPARGAAQPSPLPETGLVRLDPADRAQLQAFAELHEATLPASVPVQFGRRFMTEFYFPRLVADGLAAGDLFRFEGRWAGYNLYTKFPHSMLREAIRRHFFFLCRFMPGVLLANPRALRAIPSLLRNRGGFPEKPLTGYWLTFGVHPELRAARVDGKPIARHLVERMFEYFREERFEAVEGTTDRTNGPALIFYRTCGFQIEDRGFEDGAKVQVRYELRSI